MHPQNQSNKHSVSTEETLCLFAMKKEFPVLL